ncbi:MAG: hypothetical protein FWF83_06345 [Clostridiales bacterium]|nr:hypothetical protein [Clostridiales bacterium]
MSDVLANDVRGQYDKAFATIQKIIEAFPDDKWLQPHGDEYYIPCRIAYHLAVFIDGFVGEGNKVEGWGASLPFGSWYDGTSETLPAKDKFLPYFEAAVAKATSVLAGLSDDDVVAVLDPDQARFGASNVGKHLYFMRELSDHTGELNKMLIENGLDDIWVSR